MPVGVKGFIPGVSGNPDGRPEGTKNKTTLLKEERRALFDQWMQDKFKAAVDNAKPEYLLDQYLGKATDKKEVDITTKGEAIGLTPEKIAEINDIALDDQ